MTKPQFAVLLLLLGAATLGQSQDKLVVHATPNHGKSGADSTIYVADYVGNEFVFDGMMLPTPKDTPARLMFNCRVEIRRGGTWEVLKANWSGTAPSIMKVKTDRGLPNACKFILPKEGGKVGDCVRIVLRHGWEPNLPDWRSDPFVIEPRVTSLRSCSK